MTAMNPTPGEAVYREQLGLPLLHKGKVRELYDLDAQRMLMVATDQISAFDFILSPPIPDKGVVLTRLSGWWFDRLGDDVPNHLLPGDVPAAVAGRAVICEKLEMIPVECVARGYLTGSGWLEYAESGAVCGVRLPTGLVDGSRLPEPIFTPATKAALGEHDENVGFAEVVARVGAEVADRIRGLTLGIYRRAASIARERGLILADTKFEFGRRADGTVVLADEVLTPDSSRYWDAARWRPGVSLPSYDKQYVRDWLRNESGWDADTGKPPPPLPNAVVTATRSRYVEAFEQLTRSAFQPDGDQPGQV
jgi:phosphoribosylaminoimidazole-succinocarboxamide synthase